MILVGFFFPLIRFYVILPSIVEEQPDQVNTEQSRDLKIVFLIYHINLSLRPSETLYWG